MYQGLIHRYRDFLPIDDKSIITLHEGATPLLRAKNLEDELKYDGEIYLKYEGMNPTGSFKDRGMTYAVSKAVEEGAKAIICASTGNTSASAAAYAAKAKIQCVVLIPHGNIALGKLSQAMMHGATVVEIKGNFDEALELVRVMGTTHPIHIVNSINPFRLQGQKTAAFEICEDLGRAPDYHFIPVGNAGNITAYWMGYNEYFNLKKVSSKPVMMGFQASGAAPLVSGKVVKNPETIATAIRIGNPASWKQAIAARDASGGIIDKVTDREIVNAYKLLGKIEGVFCEPASATSVAGFIKLIKEKRFEQGKTIVCTLTGHGLKDPDTAIKNSVKPLRSKATIKDLEKVLKL
ncbi:threonine synthase [bacterium]|nr:threonine synthase [bacterium]